MTTNELVCQMKPYIQPFERILAVKELEALADASPIPRIDQNTATTAYSVVTQCTPAYLADRLAYWEQIYPADRDPSMGQLTRQVRREATTHLVRNGVTSERLRDQLPFGEEVPLPKHRNLRYGPHGIHEYRGKFFPQLVRSLLNIAGVSRDSIVLDPMCGSGTTCVEAILLGCRAIGLDLNPLSVLMSRAKCHILSVHPDRLKAEYESFKADLFTLSQAERNSLPWFEHLPTPDRDYLSRWFAPEVLADLDPIAVRVHDTAHPGCQALFQMSLSNIIRRVSWQKTDDLRVRKELRSELDMDVMTVFTTGLDCSVNTVLAFLYENQDFQVGQAQIIEGDVRLPDQILSDAAGCIDVIVTSPPYATALPYLDTDRLSLCYLELLSRPEHRRRDHDMIGNREITNGQRRSYWEEYKQRKHELPGDITAVIDRIDDLNCNADVGFRRRNKPALLARYFLDMKKVFENFRVLLRPSAPAYVVVGSNHTIAGGQRVDIETNNLLAHLGESVGLTLDQTISMEMLVSRDIFRKNTGSAETILCFRN